MKRYIHTADAVFALILFCAFALSMLMVLMTGASAYQHVRDTAENHYSEDTCISYLTMKARHFDDAADTVYLSKIEGESALFLSEMIDGDEYITAIYFHEGYVKELFAEAGYDFSLADGLEILAARSVSFEQDGALLRLTCVGTGGNTAETYLSLRNWRAAT